MRSSGILMHITSLPSPYGVGTLGDEAYAFIDFLCRSGQSCWQILPVTPTGYGDSPYQSCSAYAGNHYLIDLELLIRQGLLLREEVEAVCWQTVPERVDFGKLYENRLRILRLAYGRFREDGEFARFCRDNGCWLQDFALYMALKDRFGGQAWYRWDDPLKFRDPAALDQARRELEEEIRFYCFVQYLFHTQWQALREHAHRWGITIIGDVPIYVPYDSADVWSDPRLFYLDEKLDPIAVAGCPPDCFNADGQLWGNPLYRWDVHKQENFAWWVRRLAAAGNRYDVVRLDHFRGFESYWAVPFGDPTARGGKWIPGPGMEFVNAIKTQLPQVKMIAEDLGLLTPEVRKLQKNCGYPGMKVLGFAFDSLEPSEYLLHAHRENTVCYTGTHDNMTTRQWFETAPPELTNYAKEYLHITPEESAVWGFIRGAMSSVSDMCIIPIQDYLELGAEARMNFPGTQTGDNWTWRATPGYLYDGLAQRIYRLTKLYGRLACTQEEPQGNP